jgi:hypothetical protein
MNTDEKLLELAERLLKKTQNGSLIWERTAAFNVFQSAFPNSTIKIAEYQSTEPEEGPEYGLSIYNEHGNQIENTTDHTLSKMSHGRSFAVFSALYREARRRALGVDEAVDDLLGQLGDE